MTAPKKILVRPLHRYATLLASVTTALVLTGCGMQTSADPNPASSSTTHSGELASFEQQKLTWKACEENFECTTVQVPVDYNHPTGEKLGISVIRHRAENPGEHPALFINPGGPGGSGYDHVAQGYDQVFEDVLKKNFDIIGFDPRGVDRSGGFRCEEGKEENNADRAKDGMHAPDDIRSDSFDPALAIKNAKEFNKKIYDSCKKENGKLIDHLSTPEAARDMDIMRAAMGQEKIHYLGYSYGTELGAAYATLFPDRVGPMVLDGVSDAELDPYQQVKDQAKAFEASVRHFVERCQEGAFDEETGSCSLTGSVDDGMKQLDQLVDKVKNGDYRSAKDRKFTVDDLQSAISTAMYSSQDAPTLSSGLNDFITKEDPTLLLKIADTAAGRDEDGELVNNSSVAIGLISCADTSKKPTEKDLKEFNTFIKGLHPILKTGLDPAPLNCAGWQGRQGDEHFDFNTEQAATTPLLIGTSHDRATPGRWADSFAEHIGKAVVLHAAGWDHTDYGRGAACLDPIIEKYLMTGETPEKQDTACPIPAPSDS